MIKIYIDIDGVILTKKNTQKADYAEEFIRFISNSFDCYWLTTHCKGKAKTAMEYLTPYFDNETLTLLAKFKPTNWNTLKTESIDFNAEFYWIDDCPFLAEREVLLKYNVLDRLIIVNHSNPMELMKITTMISSS